MESATAGITAAASASAVAPAASGFYHHPSWNPANFLFCNRYQHSQQPAAQPAFDFWGGNNGYLYGQQYTAAGYQFPTIQYAAAMRQQQQQTSQQTTAPSSLSYNSAAAAALTARLLSPGNYFWPQVSVLSFGEVSGSGKFTLPILLFLPLAQSELCPPSGRCGVD